MLRHLRTGGSGSTATKRRAGRVSLSRSRRRTKGKPGIRTWRRGYACLGSAGGISYGGEVVLSRLNGMVGASSSSRSLLSAIALMIPANAGFGCKA